MGAVVTRLNALDSPPIADIQKLVLRRGRDSRGPTWFNPRACMIPSNTPGDATRGVAGQSSSRATALMALQTISGSDYFGPLHWMSSADLGATWSDPQPISALGRVPRTDGSEEGVCDVVPEWHPQTRTVLALGHNVFYSGPRSHPVSHLAGRSTRCGKTVSGAIAIMDRHYGWHRSTQKRCDFAVTQNT